MVVKESRKISKAKYKNKELSLKINQYYMDIFNLRLKRSDLEFVS